MIVSMIVESDDATEEDWYDSPEIGFSSHGGGKVELDICEKST